MAVPRGLPAKRAAIMGVAFDVFVRDGYAAASIDVIALTTGVSRQTVYNHFGDKESLFLAVVGEAVDSQLADLRAAIEGFPDPTADVEDHLVAIGRRIVATFDAPRTADLRLLVQSEAPRHPRLLALWRDRSSVPVWSSLVGRLARLDRAGLLVIDDPARAAGQLVTLVTGVRWKMTELGTFTISPPADPAELESAIRANIGMFVRAYSP